MTNQQRLSHLIQKRQLKWLGHILRKPNDELINIYAFYDPLHGTRRKRRQKILYHQYIINCINQATSLSPAKIRMLLRITGGNLQVLKMTEFLAVPLAVLHTSACISASRICAVRFVFPLAGIHNLLCISWSGNGNQNNYKISARGDAKFWLHFRKRNCRRWIVFPRGGIVDFHVHLRSRGPWTEINTKSPLAGM